MLFLLNSIFSGDMHKAFQNVSAILDKGKFKELGWQKFQGLVSEFSALKDKTLDQNGNLSMSKTSVNVSADLDKGKFKELGWQAFQGSVSEFSTLREEHLGIEGYALFAEKHFDGDMHKAFKKCLCRFR